MFSNSHMRMQSTTSSRESLSLGKAIVFGLAAAPSRNHVSPGQNDRLSLRPGDRGTGDAITQVDHRARGAFRFRCGDGGRLCCRFGTFPDSAGGLRLALWRLILVRPARNFSAPGWLFAFPGGNDALGTGNEFVSHIFFGVTVELVRRGLTWKLA